jgi:chromosome segregation ATPase
MWLTSADRQLFVQGMEDLAAKEEMPDAFAMLQQHYPDSLWTAKAQTIQALLQEIQKQQRTVKDLRAKQAVSLKQNQQLQQQVESLQNELEVLESERTKLRQLLIDLEQRGR